MRALEHGSWVRQGSFDCAGTPFGPPGFAQDDISLVIGQYLFHTNRSISESHLPFMIRKLQSGEYRLYSRKKDKSGKRKNLGTFSSLAAAKKHERAVQYFKRA